MRCDNYESAAEGASRPSVEPTQPRKGRASFLRQASVVILAVAVSGIVLAKVNIPVVRPAVAFWYMIAYPSYLLYTTSVWRRCEPEERLAYSVCAVLLTLMLAGLAANMILPALGVQRPLGTVEIVVIVGLLNLSFCALRRRYPRVVRWRAICLVVYREEARLLILAISSVVLALLGANRLNNEAGGQLAIAALAVVAVTLLLSLYWLKLLRDVVLHLVIYLVSVGLLLTTSLRGWYVTGHDIQEEYHVFQLTSANARWSMAYFHDAYMACLSITILPTELSRLLGVYDPYVFKLFFQLIFALCPVLVYGISRRYFGRGISLLAVAYFIGFPTFFTDMPFLNRQEIGLLFVAAGVFVVTNPAWRPWTRTLALAVVGVGIEVSHYSSMYVFFGTLAIAYVLSSANRLLHRLRRGTQCAHRVQPDQAVGRSRAKVTTGQVVSLAAIVCLWGGLFTGTSSQLVNAGAAAIAGLTGHSSATRAGNVSFSLFGGGTLPANEVLQKYRVTTLGKTADNRSGLYLPKAAVAKAATPYVKGRLRALTPLGSGLHAIGIPVATLNGLIRNVIAYAEQVFLIVGLLSMLIRPRRPSLIVPQEIVWLAIGSIGMLMLITVLPAISADYGVLRAFQETMVVFSPVVVIGSLTIFAPLGRRRAQILSSVTCLGLFVNTSGVIPQLLGGNISELNLNNSGTYYDLYYMRPQDEAAVGWLEKQPAVSNYPFQSSYLQTRYLFSSPSRVYGTQAIADAYPTLVLSDSWLILGYPTVGSGFAYTYTRFNGDVVEYRYPIGLLSKYKNLVYTNGETVIYK